MVKSFHILLFLHFLGNTVHLAAHMYHGVPAVFLVSLMGQTLAWVFILFSFILLPLLGWWQLWKNDVPRCYYVLAASLLPAWAYAFVYHFVLDTNDYVCLFGATVVGRWFSWSAYSIAAIDGLLFLMSVFAIVKLKFKNYRQ